MTTPTEAYEQVKAALELAKQKEERHIFEGKPSLDHGVFCTALANLEALKPPAEQPSVEEAAVKGFVCEAHQRASSVPGAECSECYREKLNHGQQPAPVAQPFMGRSGVSGRDLPEGSTPSSPHPTAQQPAQSAEDLLWLQICLREHPGEKPPSVRAALAYIGERLAGYRPAPVGEVYTGYLPQGRYEAAMKDIAAVNSPSPSPAAPVGEVERGIQMNREAYEKLMEENIAWLLLQPRTLEREHIEAVLRCSASRIYAAALTPSPAAPVGEVVHVLYKTGDADATSAILDANGAVVLDECRLCGRAEIQLGESCDASLKQQVLEALRGAVDGCYTEKHLHRFYAAIHPFLTPSHPDTIAVLKQAREALEALQARLRDLDKRHVEFSGAASFKGDIALAAIDNELKRLGAV